ncbi:MAG: sugar ABC transporter permease [Chloroflexota bacterium]
MTVQGTTVARAKPRRSSLRRAEQRFVWTILIPAILFYAAFRFYPVGFAFYMSLHDWKLLRKEQFLIGFGNYSLIFEDGVFAQAIGNTFYYAIAATILGTVAALTMAIILNPVRRGNTLFRLLYFLPTMTSAIASATIWIWLYQVRFGLLNQFLVMLGFERIPWLTSPDYALNSLILMSIWGGIGFTMIIFLAGLRGIPRAYYEAAEIDGATALQQAWHITLPLITPVITFVTVTGFIGGMNVFQQVYLMTRGGPYNSTQTIALQIYEHAFQKLFMGQAAAMAFVLFAIVIVMTVVQLRVQRTDWEF